MDKANELKDSNCRHQKKDLTGSTITKSDQINSPVRVRDDGSSTNHFKYLYKLDISLSRSLSFCADKNSGHWRTVMILLELTGHGVPWIAGSILAILMCSELKQEFACNLLFALMLDLVVVGATKLAVRRKRPVYNEQDMVGTVSVDQYSFPSGHSTRAAMVAGLFTFFLAGDLWRVLIGCWALCVSTSRVILGRHHVSDVICGVLIGLLQFWTVTMLWIPQGRCQEMLKLVPFYTELNAWFLLV